MPTQFKVVFTPCNYTDLRHEQEVLEPTGAELVRVTSHEESDLMRAYTDTDAVIIQHTVLPRKHMEVMQKCKIVVRCGVGYDELDLAAATDFGIYCANVPDYCMEEVATHAMALVLSLARRIPLAHRHVTRGRWVSHSLSPVFDLSEQTVGVVGLGRIGKSFVKKARTFFGKVLVCDPYIDSEVIVSHGAEPVAFPELLRQSDVVSLHIPLFKVATGPYAPTQHLIGENELRLMKPTAYLVNTARGPVVDKQALYLALSQDWIAGAGLDVMELEPPGKEEPLLRLDNFVATPHMSYYSETAIIRLRRQGAEEVKRVLLGERPKNLLNPDVIRDS